MNTLRRFGAAVRSIFPLRASTLAGRFRLDAFTLNLCKSRRTTQNQSTANPNGRQGGSRAWRNCGKSSLQSEYHWFSANRNTLRPICANFPFLCIELNLLNSQLNSNHGRSTNSSLYGGPHDVGTCSTIRRRFDHLSTLKEGERKSTFSIKMRRRASA